MSLFEPEEDLSRFSKRVPITRVNLKIAKLI